MGHTRGDSEDLCDTYYFVDMYLKAHSGIVYPLPEKDLDPEEGEEESQPLTIKRKTGRPKKNRKREKDEAPKKRTRSTTVKYKNCMKYMHNSRTYKSIDFLLTVVNLIFFLGASSFSLFIIIIFLDYQVSSQLLENKLFPFLL